MNKLCLLILRLVATACLYSCLLFIVNSCSSNRQITAINGSIFGTSYNIKIVASIAPSQLLILQQKITARLKSIDTDMSSWSAESQINLFNAAPINQWFSLSDDIYAVINLAQKISQLSQGAFDITSGALVKLWGFKSYELQTSIPDKEQISHALGATGFNKLQLQNSPAAILKTSAVTIDLAAIAKGYAVDKIAELLEEQGYIDYLVEIGGELRVAGKRADGNNWHLAIESPTESSRGIQRIMQLTNLGLATSGDYRNYFEYGGKRYAHSIDPHTGYPILHNLASVTVISATSATADAIATALTIMGKDKGLDFARAHQIAAFFITKETDGFREWYTPEFKQYLSH